MPWKKSDFIAFGLILVIIFCGVVAALWMIQTSRGGIVWKFVKTDKSQAELLMKEKKGNLAFNHSFMFFVDANCSIGFRFCQYR